AGLYLRRLALSNEPRRPAKRRPAAPGRSAPYGERGAELPEPGGMARRGRRTLRLQDVVDVGGPHRPRLPVPGRRRPAYRRRSRRTLSDPARRRGVRADPERAEPTLHRQSRTLQPAAVRHAVRDVRRVAVHIRIVLLKGTREPAPSRMVPVGA